MISRRRRAFTLIELLVVISIIALLASAALFAMWGVLDEAKGDRTRRQIERIDQAIQQRWDGYLTRSIPINLPASMPPETVARVLLNAFRDLMRTDLPDRITDVMDDPAISVFSYMVPGIPQPINYAAKLPLSSLQRGYRRRCMAVLGASPNNPNQPDYSKWSSSYEDSECLYLILSAMNEEGTNAVLDYFPASEIGDVDKDGMHEILDAWGRPIVFLRWAPGFYSDRQSQNGVTDPDPFDPLKVDPRYLDSDTTNDPFLLFPLIMSAGSDGAYDINTDGWPSPEMEKKSLNTFFYSMTDFPVGMRNDPYWLGDPSKAQKPLYFIGTLLDSNQNGKLEYGDNIHNHLLEVK
ncbi:MAG: type II secretion system protein [Planctomycetota bacterium]